MCRIRRGLAVMCGARAPRGGVTRQGVALTDQSDFLLINKTPLSLSAPRPILHRTLFLLSRSLYLGAGEQRESARARGNISRAVYVFH